MFDISAHIVRLEFGGYDYYTPLESEEGDRCSYTHNQDVHPAANEHLHSADALDRGVETSDFENERSDSSIHSESDTEASCSCDDVVDSDSDEICDGESEYDRSDDEKPGENSKCT
jgi:hypothetical protein